MNIKKIEDALIIHLIYLLGINPESISLLTFESIDDDDNNIKCFVTSKLSFANIKINDNLLRDILFINSIKEGNKKSHMINIDVLKTNLL